MTRTVAAIAVVVVTATLTAQAGAVVPQQGTPDEPATPADGTPAGEPAENGTAETPSVAFDDQQTDGRTVTVSNVTLTEAGYVLISEGTASDRDADSVVGTSDYLPAGEYNSVTITLFDVPGAADGETRERVTESGNLTATVHAEDTGDRSLDYVESAGLVDVPVLVDGAPVTETATVTVVEENGTDTPGAATPAEETDSPPRP